MKMNQETTRIIKQLSQETKEHKTTTIIGQNVSKDSKRENK